MRKGPAADRKNSDKKMNRQKRRDRIKNNRWENLQGFRYAHRGLFHEPRSASLRAQIPYESPLWREDIALWKAEGRKIVPENSMRAFRYAVRYGFGSELDVHLTADGKIVVFHDATLRRMAGIDRKIETMTWPELRQVRLLNTQNRIPLLEDVLDLYTSPAALTNRRDARAQVPGAEEDGTVFSGQKSGTSEQEGPHLDDKEIEQESCFLYLPLIIELKAEGNVSSLCRGVMEVVDRYPSLNYCVESFDPRVVFWFRRNRPEVIRGQLTENFMKSRDAVRKWGHLMTFGMWSVAPDILSRPDFIASKFRDRKNIFILLSHRLGVRQVNWIIKNRKELMDVEREGGLGIFERFMPELL